MPAPRESNCGKRFLENVFHIILIENDVGCQKGVFGGNVCGRVGLMKIHLPQEDPSEGFKPSEGLRKGLHKIGQPDSQ